jgi:transcriptional regulator GlxA family with amidase domain
VLTANNVAGCIALDFLSQLKSMKRERIKSYDYPYIHRAVEILRKDPARAYTITELALEVSINSYKLREGFKQLYDMTVYQYRLCIRLEMAKEILENTDLTIEEVAYKTGFGSRDSFSRAFRQKLNQCPREWRNHSSVPEEPPPKTGWEQLIITCSLN